MRDVVIVGAGPAGSLAALLLVRAGWQVTLIEQHRFPRDKVCGECLSAVGCDVLARAGIFRSLLSAGGIPLSAAKIHSPGGESAEVSLPRPMLGISRATMDSILLNAAVNAGAEVKQPARCEQIEQRDNRWFAHIRNLETNATTELAASLLILADGKSALLPPRPAMTSDLGVKAHFRNVTSPRDLIELFGVQGHYGGVAPIENDKWNIAFSIPAARVAQFSGDFDRLFEQLRRENAALSRALSDAERCSDWLASPLPRFGVRTDWPDGLIPIGNAAAAIEPIGGEGMGSALRSAEIAAEAMIAGEVEGRLLSARTIQSQFDQLWRAKRLGFRTLALALSNPMIADAMVLLVQANPRITQSIMTTLGKAK